MIKFPSDSNELLIEVFWQKGDEPFISGVSGAVCIHMLEEIEKDLQEWGEEHCLDGLQLYRAFWEKPQYDHEGRTEIPGWWDLTFIGSKPRKAQPK